MPKSVYKCSLKCFLLYNMIGRVITCWNYLSLLTIKRIMLCLTMVWYISLCHINLLTILVLNEFRTTKQPCVMLATNVIVVSSKVTNVCLEFGSNIVHYLDLCIVPNLAARIMLGMDWSIKYNPMIDWKMWLVSLDCVGNVASKEHARHTIYTKHTHCASLASVVTASKA